MKRFVSLVRWLVLAACCCAHSACHYASTLPDPLEAGWDGNDVCILVEDTVEQRVLRCTFPPGVGHERHYHDAHTGHTVRGGRMRINDSEGIRFVDIKTGSDWKSPGIKWHEVLNVGDTTTEFVITEYKLKTSK